MEIRQPIHSDHVRTLDTEGLRRHFLIDGIFKPDQATLTYSQIDRIIVGGIMPVNQAVGFAPELGRHTGTAFFLQRRELGLINIGGTARVVVDDQTFEIEQREALYVGQGVQRLAFTSVDAKQPAKLYFNCAPAHTAYPSRKITLAQASPETLGARHQQPPHYLQVLGARCVAHLPAGHGHDPTGVRQHVEHHAVSHP